MRLYPWSSRMKLVQVVDGGILALLEVDPIDKKDVKLQSWKAGPNAAN